LNLLSPDWDVDDMDLQASGLELQVRKPLELLHGFVEDSPRLAFVVEKTRTTGDYQSANLAPFRHAIEIAKVPLECDGHF
jgi:hypothetical protein